MYRHTHAITAPCLRFYGVGRNGFARMILGIIMLWLGFNVLYVLLRWRNG